MKVEPLCCSSHASPSQLQSTNVAVEVAVAVVIAAAAATAAAHQVVLIHWQSTTMLQHECMTI
jgi:hypothetical protein